MLCFILTYSYRILIFMYIFGYFFQNGHFKGSSEKRAHRQKTLGGGGDDGRSAPPAPEGMVNISHIIYVRRTVLTATSFFYMVEFKLILRAVCLIFQEFSFLSVVSNVWSC